PLHLWGRGWGWGCGAWERGRGRRCGACGACETCRPDRSDLAHPGLRQVADNGFLCWPACPPCCDAKPNHRCAHRSERPRRTTVRNILTLPGLAASNTCAGDQPRRLAKETASPIGWDCVYDDPKVLSRGKARGLSDAF